MKPIKLLIILLPVFLILTPALHSQTYITPILGYEWNIAKPQSNISNWGSVFQIPDDNKKYQLQSIKFGVLPKRKIKPGSYLYTGVIYSKYYFNTLEHAHDPGPFLFRMKTSRLKFMAGYERDLFDFIAVSSSLTFNYLHNSKMWTHPRSSFSHSHEEYYPKNRAHLGIFFSAALTFHDVVIMPHFELGIWNLNNRSEYTATRPLTGFGISLGYQIKL